jgi:hypothetical protein
MNQSDGPGFDGWEPFLAICISLAPSFVPCSAHALPIAVNLRSLNPASCIKCRRGIRDDSDDTFPASSPLFQEMPIFWLFLIDNILNAKKMAL